jgi:hypothetical protein
MAAIISNLRLTEIMQSKCINNSDLGSTVAQLVIRGLPTVAIGVRAWVRSYGICGR